MTRICDQFNGELRFDWHEGSLIYDTVEI